MFVLLSIPAAVSRISKEVFPLEKKEYIFKYERNWFPKVEKFQSLGTPTWPQKCQSFENY